MSEAIIAKRESMAATSRAATWLGFILMCLGMFMAILDIQVVATSLPAIQEALEISRDAMSWIQTAYLIAEIVAIPLTGWLTRVLTLRWMFVAAISLFTVASIGCASISKRTPGKARTCSASKRTRLSVTSCGIP